MPGYQESKFLPGGLNEAFELNGEMMIAMSLMNVLQMTGEGVGGG